MDVLLGEDWSILDDSIPNFISFKQYFQNNREVNSRYLGDNINNANIYLKNNIYI